MAKPRTQIYADLPPELQDAEDLLKRYGQWAMDRGQKRRCGSAEGSYRASGEAAQDARRTPSDHTISSEEALRCQRALTATADRERIVLTVMYVPQRLPIEAQLRLLRIPPQLAQVRHLTGMRMFWNRYRMLEMAALDSAARRADTMAPPRRW